ncbi:hypothetical protein JCM11491_007181 [Sporobolomyces phaffii]
MTDPGSSSTLQEPRRDHRSTDYSLAPSLAPSPFDSASPSSRKGSITSVSSTARQMLPSHPSALPHFYGSEASASGDESADGHAANDRATYAVEKKRREEARQRRRAKQGSVSSSIPSREIAGQTPTASPAKRSQGGQHHATENSEGHSGIRQGDGAMLEGLGFEGLPGTDYQVLVDEAAYQSHPVRQNYTTTYSSSLGSAVPSPSQSASPFSSRPPRRSRQASEASHVTEDQQDTPRIMVNEVPAIEEAELNRVRFGSVSGESIRERRSRRRPITTSIPLESDHIVFPETLPPSFPPQSNSQPVTPVSPTFFTRRSVPPSPSHTGPPSVVSLHHGIGSYGSSAGSIASQSSIQLVLDDPIPTSPRFNTPSGRSTRSRGRSNSSNSIEDSPAPLDPQFTPNSRSARHARRPTGPTTIVGEMLTQQEPGRLYFPSPSPKRAGSTASSERSPPLSIISSVFPSRPRPASHLSAAVSPATSYSSQLAFPPPPASSKPTQSLVFPSAPAPSSPPRFGRSRYAQRSFPSSPQASLPNSPSFASTLSSMSVQSVEQPVFPTLGAQLAPDGLVRSGITPRRVSGTPWERSAAEAAQGDELDRMMAAQMRTSGDDAGGDVTDAKFREREKERKRRNIYNELIRSKTSDSIGAPEEELDSFQRELLARDTVKKSLGAKLMSEEPSRPTSDASEEEDADSTGITPSTSASSDMSTLPPFPDVPTHTYHVPASTSYHSGITVEDPDQVEVVLSSASSAAPSPITPTFSYSYHPTTPPSKRQSHRVSLASSTSDKSHYEDAQEEPTARVSEDGGSRNAEPRLELAKQQTSLWVLDTLASAVTESPSRPLSDIGETEEPEEVVKDTSPVASDPVEAVVPPSARSSTFSIPTQSPSMAAVQRCHSPTLSQGSRSTASSAPVSYTAPKRLPVASAMPLKSKSTFGKKLGAFFGGGQQYNAAALGLRSSGISSRDVVSLQRPSSSDKQQSYRSPATLASKPPSEFSSHTRASSSGSHTRSHSHSSSTFSAFPPIPTTPSSFSNATFASPRVGGPASSSSAAEPDNGAHKLADLLSKFEQEDKARFKGIAESRLGRTTSSNAVVV